MASNNIFKWVIGIAIIMVIFVLAAFVLKVGLTTTESSGSSTTSLSINAAWVKTISSTVFTEDIEYWGQLILYLAVLMIMIVGLGDILTSFTSFKTPTAWVIATGVGIVVSVSGIVKAVVAWIGIAGGVSAFGIGVIIITGVVSAIAINFALMWSGLKVAGRMMKSRANADKAVTDYKHLREVAKGISKADEEAA